MAKMIGLDTAVWIYLLEEHPRYVKAAEALLRRVHSGELGAVFSSIGLIEILTGPKQLGRYDLATQYRELITSFPHLTIVGMNESIVELASELRARYRVATPDAIHLATAIDAKAGIFYSNDKALKKVREITVKDLGPLKN